MRIPENRIYPFPMFANTKKDYKDNVFDVDIEYKYDYDTVNVSIQSIITNGFILDNIKSGKFNLVLHVECTKTKFRNVYTIPYETINNSCQISVGSENLMDEAEIVCLLIAMEDVLVTDNDTFEDFYMNDSIHFPRFAIIGYSDTFKIDVKKKLGINQQPSSICNIVKAQVQDKQFSLEGDTIAILLPEEDHKEYLKLQGSFTRTKHAVFVEPALMYTLDKIKQDQDGIYCKKEWYKALHAACKRHNIDIESEEFKETETYVVASMLLNDSYHDALFELNINNKDD